MSPYKRPLTPPRQRGGAGNIESPGLKATKATPGDTDVIPGEAIKRSEYENYHVGRGGQGNVHKEHEEHEEHEGGGGGLKKKVEHLFGGKKGEEGEGGK